MFELVNTDGLAEQRYADRDPQFEPADEPDRDEEYIRYLYDISDGLDEIRNIIRTAKETLRTRKFNALDRQLSELEDTVDEMLERGL